MINLIKGNLYRIKDTKEIKVCDTPMEYCGTENYQGETYHNFYDPIWRLFHWINPDEVEEVASTEEKGLPL